MVREAAATREIETAREAAIREIETVREAVATREIEMAREADVTDETD